MVTLYNVIDTRTGKFHSEVIVKQHMVRFFAPAEEVLQEQVMAVSTTNEDEGATR